MSHVHGYTVKGDINDYWMNIYKHTFSSKQYVNSIYSDIIYSPQYVSVIHTQSYIYKHIKNDTSDLFVECHVLLRKSNNINLQVVLS